MKARLILWKRDRRSQGDRPRHHLVTGLVIAGIVLAVIELVLFLLEP